jgi:replicative DNA helicase
MTPRFDLVASAAGEVLLLAIHYLICRTTAFTELESKHFNNPGNQTLLHTARELRENEVEFDLASLQREILRQAESESRGTQYVDYGRALDLLHQRYAFEPLTNTPTTQLTEILTAIGRANPATSQAATPLFLPSAGVIPDVLNDAALARNARMTGTLRGPITGIKGMDEKMGGCMPQEGIIVVLGNTGAGKTAFALQVRAIASSRPSTSLPRWHRASCSAARWCARAGLF